MMAARDLTLMLMQDILETTPGMASNPQARATALKIRKIREV